MFGFSTREILTKTILNTSTNFAKDYKQLIKEYIEDIAPSKMGGDEEVDEKVFMGIRRAYLDKVADAILNTFSVSSPSTHFRLQMLLLTPGACGYDIDIENGVAAGSLYAMCFYAVKGKTAAAKDCVYLNHKQNDIMQNALHEVYDELRLQGCSDNQ